MKQQQQQHNKRTQTEAEMAKERIRMLKRNTTSSGWLRVSLLSALYLQLAAGYVMAQQQQQQMQMQSQLQQQKQDVSHQFTCGKLYYRTFHLDQQRNVLYVGAM